jgi:hypothetical protein
MNAFLLPGMGQLYLGRRVTGIVLILIVNLLILMALFVVLKGAAPLISAKIAAGSVSAGDLHTALQGVSGYGKAVLAAFAAVWGLALFDVIKNGDSSQ